MTQKTKYGSLSEINFIHKESLISCLKCQHPHFVKNGFINEKQRYKCPDCDYQSMNAIAKMLDTAPSTILKWIRNFGNEHAQPPEPQADAVVLELDEMWHYLKKLWIWKAFCRDTGELIA